MRLYPPANDQSQITQSSSRIRNAAASRPTALNAFHPANSNATSALSSSAAAQHASSEQQFIESTPWANPNHPIHRLGRQSNNRSPFAESVYTATATPAHQQKRHDYTPQPHGSGGASTIVENPTPQTNTEVASSAMKQEPGTGAASHAHSLANGMSATNGDVSTSISPSDTRRTINNMLQAGATAAAQQQALTATSGEQHYVGVGVGVGVNSSPLVARASLLSSLNRTASAAGTRESTQSPFRQDVGVMAASGPGMGRFGFR